MGVAGFGNKNSMGRELFATSTERNSPGFRKRTNHLLGKKKSLNGASLLKSGNHKAEIFYLNICYLFRETAETSRLIGDYDARIRQLDLIVTTTQVPVAPPTVMLTKISQRLKCADTIPNHSRIFLKIADIFPQSSGSGYVGSVSFWATRIRVR
jgi:hypothetical protein